MLEGTRAQKARLAQRPRDILLCDRRSWPLVAYHWPYLHYDPYNLQVRATLQATAGGSIVIYCKVLGSAGPSAKEYRT